MALAPGTRLGPYEILSLLGAGGMGMVYHARDTRLERTVAIKILSQLSDDPAHKQRFEREARAISGLNHPNICTLHDVGHQNGIDYLVMECVEGETLAKRLERGPLPVDQVLRVGAQIADALTAAHAHGIIHRDLKPGNVMETPKGIKLLDFGLAKYVTSTLFGDAETTLTVRGAVLGTPAYMAPEQLEGHDCDARTDVFALGLVLFEMTTSSRPFGGSSQAQLISQIMHGEPAFEKVAPAAFRRLVERCLAKDPCETLADRVGPQAGSRRSGEESGIDAHNERPAPRNDKAPEISIDGRSCGIGTGRCSSCVDLVDSQSASPDSPNHQIGSPDHRPWSGTGTLAFARWKPGGIFMERAGPGELRHLCEDYKSRSRGGRAAFTADARSGRRYQSSVVAGRKFDRFPA
jgi:serine/threonine protein kinase